MILGVILAAFSISKCLSKQFILLPYNNELCQNSTRSIYKYYEFTINQQINLNTLALVSDVMESLKHSENVSKVPTDGDINQYYLCRTLVKPMGRPLDFHNEYGEYSFWNIRIRIDRIPGINSCNDYLLLQFRHEKNLITDLDGHSFQVFNITCHTILPLIIPSQLQKLYLTYFSSSSTDRSIDNGIVPSLGGYIINVTSFIYFLGNFPLTYQQDMCRRQDGFWCGNETACIFRDMSCDGYDSCFDGGSDEAECQGSNNMTIQGLFDKRSKGTSPSSFVDYLPWLALGILPLILLLALICICNQHRSEVYFDDEEDGLEVDKCHGSGDEVEEEEEDGNGSGDGRWPCDKGKSTEDTVEEAECYGDGTEGIAVDNEVPGSLGLVPISHSTDVTTATTLTNPISTLIYMPTFGPTTDTGGHLIDNPCTEDVPAANHCDNRVTGQGQITDSSHNNGSIIIRNTANDICHKGSRVSGSSDRDSLLIADDKSHVPCYECGPANKKILATSLTTNGTPVSIAL